MKKLKYGKTNTFFDDGLLVDTDYMTIVGFIKYDAPFYTGT